MKMFQKKILCIVLSTISFVLIIFSCPVSVSAGTSISLDVSNCSYYGQPLSWYIWTWADGRDGYIVSGQGDDPKNILFADCQENVTVLCCLGDSYPDEIWANVLTYSTEEKVQGNHATVNWNGCPKCISTLEWEMVETDSSEPETQIPRSLSVDISNCNDPNTPASWYIWTWADYGDGHLIYSSGEENHNVFFDECEKNIVVVRCPQGEIPDENWTNVYSRSSVEVIQSDHLTVFWDDEPFFLKVKWDNEVETTETGTTETSTTETVSTEPPETTEPTEITTAPKTTQPEITTVPTATDSDMGDLTAVIKLFDKEIKRQEIHNDTFKVIFNMTYYESLIDGQFCLKYNKNKLLLDNWKFPIVYSSLIENMDYGLFNFTSVKKPYNFESGGVLVECEFKVIDNAQGEASINLYIEELDSVSGVLAADSQYSYAGKSAFDSIEEGVEIISNNSYYTTSNQTNFTESTEITTSLETKTEAPEIDTTSIATEQTTAQFVFGDVNGDGGMDVRDSTWIQRYVAKIISFTDKQKIIADVYKDGLVDVRDATMIQRYIAKILPLPE